MVRTSRLTGNLSVHDLPQVYQKPAAGALIQALESLSAEPPAFSTSAAHSKPIQPHGDPTGVPRYITTIVSSSLNWIEGEDAREKIWSLASLRLSERSGRIAMPSMTRSFLVTDEIDIKLHEPSLTGDNLGLKTWTSSLLLSRILRKLEDLIPQRKRLLELGAGTGLAGIAAACIWKADVVLTDLPEVVSNLERNLVLNKTLVESCGGTVAARVLDWSNDHDVPGTDSGRFQLIMTADPIYSPNHPRILVETISRWLSKSTESRVVIALPLRGGYDEERTDLRNRLEQANLKMVVDGQQTGYDDWYTQDGTQAEVECSWSVWQWQLGKA